MDQPRLTTEAGRPARASERVDAACDRFEAAWRAGAGPRIEDYVAQAARQSTRKRGGGQLVGESAVIGGNAAEACGLDRILADEPGPEVAAMVIDEYRRLRDRLGSELLRQMLDLRLQGYTREEIANRLGCAERTVRRKLELIREAWLQGES